MHSRELRRRRRDKDKLVYFSDDEILDVYCNVSTMGTDEEYEQIELRHIIRDAIKNELTDLQRTAVIYVFYERYTHKQTAEIMGVSKSTVDTYICRAYIIEEELFLIDYADQVRDNEIREGFYAGKFKKSNDSKGSSCLDRGFV